ncbi:MAG: ribulose-phosphate 3-epimerase [Candidatus Accumulibacter sp.]|jgi:ribulose-phosphate 3-epimerase|nr:ribulose-phosphate 3-epimerase [Accumulibacter sp.]
MSASRIINAPSVANCPLLEFGRQVEELAQGGVQWFHVDLMDGHYVPNLCLPARVVGELKQAYPAIETDVHLMVADPLRYLPLLKENRADWVSFHIDATNFSRRTLATIREMGMKAGVVINPSQPIGVLEPLIHFVDYVVLMTVEPGYAGQRFMADSLPRVSELAALREKHGLDFLISIDGGVDYPNAIECARRGAEVYVTGIYTVFRQPDGIAEACRRFQRTLDPSGQKTEDRGQ